MGKNPNAKKLKDKKKGQERQFGNNIDDLEEEAARLGISVYELERVKKDLGDSESEDESGSDREPQPKKKVVKKK